MKPGDRVFLSGGYDMEPEWLCGRRGHRGVIERLLPGRNENSAVLVRLDEPIQVQGVLGQYIVMKLRYVGATWDADQATASVELCGMVPDANARKERRQGKLVESHATIETETSAIARGAVMETLKPDGRCAYTVQWQDVGQPNSTPLEGLDDCARSFADALFAAVPELRDHARVEKGVLRIDVRPGPPRQGCDFWISTDDGEITVGFGMFHMHFDWPDGEDVWPSDPIQFIRSVMSDETLIEDWTLDGKWSGSGILAPTEEPDLQGMKPGHVIFVRSWSGARDRTIRGR